MTESRKRVLEKLRLENYLSNNIPDQIRETESRNKVNRNQSNNADTKCYEDDVGSQGHDNFSARLLVNKNKNLFD